MWKWLKSLWAGTPDPEPNMWMPPLDKPEPIVHKFEPKEEPKYEEVIAKAVAAAEKPKTGRVKEPVAGSNMPRNGAYSKPKPKPKPRPKQEATPQSSDYNTLSVGFVDNNSVGSVDDTPVVSVSSFDGGGGSFGGGGSSGSWDSGSSSSSDSSSSSSSCDGGGGGGCD